ncbi:hypothetical protein L1887_48191 [Cichorium endivia]|nr:hypothetical protein L1887_48191 [Cichorium endivia]
MPCVPLSIPPSKARAQGIVADPQRPIKPRHALGCVAVRAAAHCAAGCRCGTCRRTMDAACMAQHHRPSAGIDRRAVCSHRNQWLPQARCGGAVARPLAATTTYAASYLTKRPATGEGEAGLKPFYYAWRPATVYRKSHPPAPEFRIVILNARTTPLPSVWQFGEGVCAHPDAWIGRPSSSASLPSQGEMGEEEFKQRVEYEKQLKAANDAKNRAAYGKFSEGKQKHLREKAAARQAGRREQGRFQRRQPRSPRRDAAYTHPQHRRSKVAVEAAHVGLRVAAHVGETLPTLSSGMLERQGVVSGATPTQQRNNAGANVFPPAQGGPTIRGARHRGWKHHHASCGSANPMAYAPLVSAVGGKELGTGEVEDSEPVKGLFALDGVAALLVGILAEEFDRVVFALISVLRLEPVFAGARIVVAIDPTSIAAA